MTDAIHTGGRPNARPILVRGPSYLFGPLVDFLCLGGGSLIVCGAIALIYPNGITNRQQGILITLLMLLINQPHFAHSYQIFYRNFREKAFGATYPAALRLRYINAGIAVPAALILFVAAAMASTDAQLLAYGANLMGLVVGWHYVKQGYGILMVDAVQKRLFFSDRAKLIFRINGYACWAVAWIALNRAIEANSYLGLIYYTLPVPEIVYRAAVAFAAVTTAAALAMFAAHWRQTGGKLPWNGIVAYLTTLYLWVVFFNFNPLVAAVIPAFHSLQYSAVVWRYKLNAGRAGPRRDFIVFVTAGLLLGYLGFMGLPWILDRFVPIGNGALGATPFLFAAFILINVHHYFLDNVIWRRGNPDVQKHLFAPAAPVPH